MAFKPTHLRRESCLPLYILCVELLHVTYNQGNKYMETCRTILCINICNVFHKGVTG